MKLIVTEESANVICIPRGRQEGRLTMFLLLVVTAFVVQPGVVRGWRQVSNPYLQQRRQLLMVTGRGFEKSDEVEISLDGSDLKQNEKDLIGKYILLRS